MDQRFSDNDKIGAIVTEFPGASNLFKQYKIDFCCGGGKKLTEVIQARGLDGNEIVRQLNEAYAELVNKEAIDPAQWKDAPIADLVDHIVNRHHVYLRKELPLLSEFITKVYRVHGNGHEELALLYRAFHQLKLEMDQHLIAEEETLFPLLIRYAEEPTAEARKQVEIGLLELESDHSAVGDLLREMRAITDGYKLPEDACKTYTLTFIKLEELESDIFEHVHLENNILFPRIGQLPVA
ncbi:iron-sulfur cluster repair di-iron protein [Paenibacillus sp. PR3]|uniref:Iron-sulfur cluster repair di-iron protein n=1 Tax=Paenibacillus terricola TaxID=2763503 RepID=A0ABR8MVL5_9BACL|nr:iron-sulfur cluster repair di-iron protein [Paenibacillus terricola]MBD3918569.1 iron-sulfur cluster repair di-iron protein [Paenibacillus terricola]